MGEDPGLADSKLAVPPGRDALPHIWRVHALFPSPQGILGGPHAQDESVWLKHPHDVSVLAPQALAPCSLSPLPQQLVQLSLIPVSDNNLFLYLLL